MIDIVLPVFNSYHHVHACLDSLKNCMTTPFKLYVMDDASHQSVHDALAIYLKEEFGDRAELHRNEENLGYLDTVNKGIKLGSSEIVVLLNSDTLVFPKTFEKVATAFEADPSIGVLTAISTWANWTRIPFPSGYTCVELNDYIEQSDEFKGLTDIQNASGFFFAVQRSVYNELGLYDEVYRPGYYEEADFCMRALAAGKRVVVDKGLYVFHHGWGSFGEEQRTAHMDRNARLFHERWGAEYRDIEEWWNTSDPLLKVKETLQSLSYEQSERSRMFHPSRETVEELIASIKGSPELYVPNNSVSLPIVKDKKVLYVLPSLELYGGVISVIQIVNNLILQGVDANIAVSGPVSDELMRSYPTYFRPYVFQDIVELVRNFPECDMAVATSWHTVMPLVAARELYGVRLAYFVQDFEPEFYPEGSELYQDAFATYDLIPDRIAKSKWLIDRLEHFGGNNYHVPLGLNTDIFQDYQGERALQIIAHARPSSPYRNFSMLQEVYKSLAKHVPECRLAVFGRGYHVSDFEVEVKDYGQLSSPQEVARALNESTILLDPSTFQGFGRPGLEAMACGTAAVLTRNGGITEYAKHLHNCLLVNPQSNQDILERLVMIVRDTPLRDRLVREGKRTAAAYDYRLEGKRTAKVFETMRATRVPALQVAL